MIDIAAFTQGWPNGSVPSTDPWYPFIPPTLAPEETKARRALRAYIREAYFIRPDEVPLYRRYIAGTVTPEEKFELDRSNGFVSLEKDVVEASGLAVAHAEAELFAQDMRLDLPTRLLNHRYLTDSKYETQTYLADLRTNAPLHGNPEAVRLFVEVQQAFEHRLIPVIRRSHAAEIEQNARMCREIEEEVALARAVPENPRKSTRRTRQ